jgi:hypothetical protein
VEARRSSAAASAPHSPRPSPGIECGLPGNAAHLLAEGARPKGNAVIGVIDHVELPGRRQHLASLAMATCSGRSGSLAAVCLEPECPCAVVGGVHADEPTGELIPAHQHAPWRRRGIPSGIGDRLARRYRVDRQKWPEPIIIPSFTVSWFGCTQPDKSPKSCRAAMTDSRPLHVVLAGCEGFRQTEGPASHRAGNRAHAVSQPIHLRAARRLTVPTLELDRWGDRELGPAHGCNDRAQPYVKTV